MKTRIFTFFSVCALFAGIELFRALDEHFTVSAQVPGRMMGSFTAFPPVGTPLDRTAFENQIQDPSITTQLMATDSNQVCELHGTTGVGLSSFRPYGMTSRVPFNFALGSLERTNRADLMITAPAVASQMPFKAFHLTATPPALLGELTDIPGLSAAGMDVGFGDLNGDGHPEALLAAGPGVRGDLHVIRLDNDEVKTYQPFGPDYRGGLRIALGNVNRRRGMEVAIAQATGNEVRLYKFASDLELTEFGRGFPLGPSYDGGLNIALGDLNNDCGADLIVAAGAGTSTLVRLFDVRSGMRGLPVRALGEFKVAEGESGGVRVAAMKINGEPAVVATAARFFYKYGYVNDAWAVSTGFARNPFQAVGNILFGLATYTPEGEEIRDEDR